MAPDHVCLDQVGEHEAAVREVAQPRDRTGDALPVRLGGHRAVDVLAGEDVRDLADGVHAHPGLAKPLEVVRPRRQQREVVPVWRPLVGARLALERPRDHTADRVLACEQPAGRAAGRVQLLERHRLLVGRDLKHAVGGRVDDPASGALVLLAEQLDDLGARGGDVADHAAAGQTRELI